MDIAEIAQTDEDEDENIHLNDTLNTLQQTLSNNNKTNKNMEELYSQVKSDDHSGHTHQKTNPSSVTNPTFVVNDDGSFQQS